MARWWKDRDKIFHIPPQEPPRHHDHDAPKDQGLSGEDSGDIADEDVDELDDVEPPDRSVDQ